MPKTRLYIVLFFLSSFLSRETSAIPNPASVYCIEKGGESILATSSTGQYGICLFPDGKQCEEWAMMWEYCPVGGIDIANLAPAEAYCLITGGMLLDHATNCKLFTGKMCGLKDYYLGKCQRN
jgi:putative hemolysin